MSPRSPVFLEVVDFEREPEVRRVRSNGYLDCLEDQEIWNRRDKERQMVPYHRGKHYGATHQRAGSNLLDVPVPIYEVNPRHHRRARSDVGSRMEDSPKPFTIREVSPRPDFLSKKDESVAEERMRPSNQTKSSAFERPKIRIPPVIIQKELSESNAADQKPRKSPRSPSGQPKLQYKYLVLQNKLADISLACVRYIDVEAANPRDLTFEKISEQVQGFQFDLRVWSSIANIENMARRDVPEEARAVADAASRNMDRLIERVTELHDACAKAKPNDLKFKDLPRIDDEETMFDDPNHEPSQQDPTESIGYIINASLHSIKLQTKSLKRLTRSLQEATPDARDEVEAVSSLVKEVGTYFGSEAALERHPIDTKFSGRRALEEARFAAAH
ncbi:hypothetical protein HBI81_116660 [Parastagonospora nodorum]|nr:hypothetical protein HBI09_125360 [Parastagonospora nodorum]KAH5002511.1 hypothetical protein HBI77_136100 [Parastagonospora nodorum]KAH5098435.1 hypothetical protein HBH72_117050 [Parastagonospora nodorum]KAH5113841.1 hypothetical protein HBH71_151290 [Parastagonospora nodorum]KAH6452095.1 hypothetical protein HBI57_166060 [Parastagonospora nodorum]